MLHDGDPLVSLTLLVVLSIGSPPTTSIGVVAAAVGEVSSDSLVGSYLLGSRQVALMGEDSFL